MNSLPDIFVDRLKTIIPEASLSQVLKGFEQERAIAVRINTIKANQEAIEQQLKDSDINFSQTNWISDALVLNPALKEKLDQLPQFAAGELYRQGLSSMLVPIILDPKPEEEVLDLCAAPGSKTTQIAAMMQNKGCVVAIESVKKRYYKLKSVVELLGVENAHLKMMDGRRFKSSDIVFDKILVDAPCSSEGRFNVSNPKTFAFWSLRKIKEMRKKQKGLLLNASRYLKLGGRLVYSTCTFAPEENEEVVNWFLKKTDGAFEVEPYPLKDVQTYPCVLQWKEREFHESIKECLRILPTDTMEGFFVAVLRRVK